MHIRHESLSISLYFLLCTETKYVQFLSNEVFHRTFFCTLNSHDVGVTAKSLCNSGRCTNVMFIRPTTVKVTKCYDFYQCTGITIWCFPRTCSCQICKMWGWTNKIANWLLNLFFSEKLHFRDDFTPKFNRTFCKLEYHTYLESAERSHTNQKKCSAVAKMGDRLATIDGAKNWGACALFWGVGPHLPQCGLGRGLPPYQVASWSIQPFGHNRYGQKIGGCAPLREGSWVPI